MSDGQLATDDFVREIDNLLKECHYQKVKMLMLDPRNSKRIKENGMDLIFSVCKHLNADTVHWSRELEECCEYSLLIIAQHANPKETLLGLQEQVELFGNSSKFKILLLPIQAVLLRISDKQSKILDWVLGSIGEHVQVLPLPEIQNLEGKERVLMDADPKVQCIADIYEALAEFYRPFVNAVSLVKPKSKLNGEFDVDRRRQVLQTNLLQLMSSPLVVLDISQGDRLTPSSLRRTAEKLISLISLITGDVFSLLELPDKVNALSGKEDQTRLEPLAVANLFYLLYGEDVPCVSLPCVYHRVEVFHTLLPYVIMLLKHEQLAVHKGLLLLRGLLRRIEDFCLGPECLDLPAHVELSQALANTMVYCEVREERSMAVEVFRQHAAKFNMVGRYQFLKSLLTSLTYSGVKGLVIGLIKDNIVHCFSSGTSIFFRDNLRHLIPLIWNLPNKEETDLLENFDSVMGALNLARFLILRDKDSNSSGFLEEVSGLESEFVKPLGVALQMSRAHYELELKKIRTNEPSDLSLSVQVPNLPRDAKKNLVKSTLSAFDDKEARKKVIMSALTAFDMLESVLARVSECIAMARNKK